MLLPEESWVRLLRKGLPLLRTLNGYRRSDLLPDLLAGLTVGIMLTPQSIAYSSLAGLPPQFGLYSALCGGLTYALLGSIPQLTIGPSAILALLTYQFAGEDQPQMVAFIAFLCGLSQLLFGLLRLGFIVDFVSMPVISAFSSASSLIIAAGQLKHLFGLHIRADHFAPTIYYVCRNLGEVSPTDTLLGLLSLVLLIGTKFLKDKYLKENQVMFYISASKNAIVVALSTTLAYVFYRQGNQPFALTGEIAGGLPEVSFPSFGIEVDGVELSIGEILMELGPGILTINFISITTNIVVAKVFAPGKHLDASMEIIALGATNLLGSFIGSMPVCASFSRSAVNCACGVRTTLSGLYTVILVLLSLVVLTPTFHFIPKATLAAVVISAVIFMVETDIIFSLWKTNRKDLVPAVGTIFSSLCFGIHYGLVIGIAIDLAFLLYHTSRPSISFDLMEVGGQQYWMVTPRTGLMFPAGSHIEERVAREAARFEKSSSTILVFNLIHVSHTDYTAGQVLKNIISDIRGKFKHCVTLNGRKNVIKQLETLIPDLEHVQSLAMVTVFIGYYVVAMQTPVIAMLPKLFHVSSSRESIKLKWEVNQEKAENLICRVEMRDKTYGWITKYWGTKTECVIKGLGPETLYYFRLLVSNELGGKEVMSDVLTTATNDGAPMVFYLMKAIERGDLRSLQMFLTERKDSSAVDAFDKNGETALIKAIKLGDSVSVKRLLSVAGGGLADPDLGTRGNGPGPLSWACLLGHTELALHLVEAVPRGADINRGDWNRLTPLHYAAESDQLNSVRFCISYGAKVNAQDTVGWTPLSRAVIFNSSEDLIQELIDNGANTNIKDRNGKTALDHALINKNQSLVELLKNHMTSDRLEESNHDPDIDKNEKFDKEEEEKEQTTDEIGGSEKPSNFTETAIVNVKE